VNEERLARWFGDAQPKRAGTGWVSGVLSVTLGVMAVGAVLCLHFPAVLTSPELRAVYPMPAIRGLIQVGIVVAFVAGLRSTWVRRRKALGLTGMGLAIVATLLGGADVPIDGPVPRLPHLGLDWFLLSLLLTGLVFVPLERAFPLRPSQPVFRSGWTTDVTYFFASHGLVQVLSLLILLPAAVLGQWLAVPSLRGVVSSLPLAVQLVAIIVVADLTQYWLHRAFHEVPLLWRIHRVHHSSRTLDWIAGSRLHLVDIVVTRGLVLMPIMVLGFAPAAVYAYLVFVSMHAVLIHANVRLRAPWLERVLVLPRFHHWHHADAPEAINRNYAVHVPWLDTLFGTAHVPDGWPESYGVGGVTAPEGFVAQVIWPLRR
jgi:sterol desaturase/sphingolipid hydroxylase (fatty acid hydroxylase superfamily)